MSIFTINLGYTGTQGIPSRHCQIVCDDILATVEQASFIPSSFNVQPTDIFDVWYGENSATYGIFTASRDTSGAITLTQFTPDAPTGPITYAEIQNVSPSRILGNPTFSAAPMQEISATLPLFLTGTTLQVSGASVGGFGVVELAPNGGTTAGTVIQANDTRIGNIPLLQSNYFAAGVSAGSAGDPAHCASQQVIQVTIGVDTVFIPVFTQNT